MDGLTYTSRVPRWMGSQADAAECWALVLPNVQLEAAGFAVVTRDGDEWIVTGPVRPVGPAPTEPAAVEGAKTLAARMSPGDEWDTLPTHVRNWYTSAAADVLNAAGPHLRVSPR